MNRDITSALEAEIASLEAELRSDIRFVRLEALRQTLALYTLPVDPSDTAQPPSVHTISPGQIIAGSINAEQLAKIHLKSGSVSAAQIAKGGRFTVMPHHAGRRTSTSKAEALDAAVLLLKNRSGPVPTRDILDHLIDHGIDIGGNSPLNNLSATLSNSDRFKSIGRAGWVLAGASRSNMYDTVEARHRLYREVVNDFIREQSSEYLARIKNEYDITGNIPSLVSEELSSRLSMHDDYQQDPKFEVSDYDGLYNLFIKSVSNKISTDFADP